MTAEKAVCSLPNQQAENVADEISPLISVVLIPGKASALELMDLLVALDAQIDTDFEIVIVASSPRIEERLAELLAWFSSGLSNRSRIVPGPHDDQGHGVDTLRAGIAAATGRYVTFLEGQSIVFANFTETFARLAAARPGTVLRARALVQPVRELQWPNGLVGFEPVGGARPAATQEIPPLAQLSPSQSPLGSYAITRSYFDNDFVSLEKAELLHEATMHCGLNDAKDEIILLIRYFVEVQSLEPDKERNVNQRLVMESSQSSLTAPESLIGVIDKGPVELENSTKDQLNGIRSELAAARQELDRAKAELVELRKSTSWRITAPIRWLSRMVRGRRFHPG